MNHSRGLILSKKSGEGTGNMLLMLTLQNICLSEVTEEGVRGPLVAMNWILS